MILAAKLSVFPFYNILLHIYKSIKFSVYSYKSEPYRCKIAHFNEETDDSNTF